MSHGAHSRKPITGEPRRICDLLRGNKYSIDYYQREYKWKTNHIADLLTDLLTTFRRYYRFDDIRETVKQYGHYFLGSIIVCDKDGDAYLVDGQQRLTTLTLLLVYLRHRLHASEDKEEIAPLIQSRARGHQSFNLDIAERKHCMEALFKDETRLATSPSESVNRILARYNDINELFPVDMLEAPLLLFVDWLLYNVHIIEITAYSDADAYTIFETMNDRGASLTPLEMLKGYLLHNIETSARSEAQTVWRNRVNALSAVGKGESSDAMKAWLRSQYAETIRKHNRNAEPGDFDLIGTEFHRWIRQHTKRLRLHESSEFVRFIREDFEFYGHWYQRIRRASKRLSDEDGLECIYFNAEHNFTLQYPLLLASLGVDDPEPVVLRKLRVVAAWIDILIHRRIWNWRAFDYSTMQHAAFQAIRDIRRKSVDELVSILSDRLQADEEDFGVSPRGEFGLHRRNGPQVHRLLARMTDYLQTESGQQSRYIEYSKRGRGGYEIEHIWADHAERHVADFEDSTEFAEYRNRIGGLLLLPKSFNASYGDLPYEDKRPHYLEQNLLAQSLHEQSYERNPGFRRLRDESGLPFHPAFEFRRAQLDERQALYRMLVERIWSPKRLGREAKT